AGEGPGGGVGDGVGVGLTCWGAAWATAVCKELTGPLGASEAARPKRATTRILLVNCSSHSIRCPQKFRGENMMQTSGIASRPPLAAAGDTKNQPGENSHLCRCGWWRCDESHSRRSNSYLERPVREFPELVQSVRSLHTITRGPRTLGALY